MKALALVEAPDHVCGRYRISAYVPALLASGWTLDVEEIGSTTLSRIRNIHRAANYDCVILQRKLLPRWQLSILRRRSRRFIFDFDDAVLYRDSYDSRGPVSRRRASRFAHTVTSAQLVIAGNSFLAECAAERGAWTDRIRVIPTCIETDRYQPKANTSSREDPVRLVWIGSSSTLQGLEQQRHLLERLGHEIPGLILRLVCDRFPSFEPLTVESRPWSAETEAADLAGGDIGISWIPDDLWSRGKCGLKVLQFFAAGLPVVANPVGVHREMIVPGVNGFLARTDDEWVDVIRSLVRDVQARRRMGQEARRTVERQYSVAAWSSRFVSAIDGRPEVLTPNVRPAGQAVQR